MIGVSYLVNVEMHCHLLPGVDDGARDVEEALELINEMKDLGVERIYLTPHLYSPKVPTDISKIKKAFSQFKEIVSNEVEILPGSEIYLVPGVSNRELIPLGDTNFLLIELPTDIPPLYLWEEIDRLQRKGYVLILAHVERYGYFYKCSGLLSQLFRCKQPKKEFFDRLRQQGVLFQVNWDILSPKTGKTPKHIRNLLEITFVDFTGSDKHRRNDSRQLIDFSTQLYKDLRNGELL